MKSNKVDLARAVLIARGHWDVPVRVGLHSYMRFSRWLDGELRTLVDRWAHSAAPNASAVRRSGR